MNTLAIIKEYKKYFDYTYFDRGLKYAQEHRVETIEENDEGVIFAEVKGSGREVYHQTIRTPNGKIRGECTCPIGYNCKHVAAVIITMIINADSFRNSSLFKNMDIVPKETSVSVPKASNTAPPQLPNWLLQAVSDIERTVKREQRSPTESKKHLIYVLQTLPEGPTSIGQAVIEARIADRKKDGTLGPYTSHRLAKHHVNLPPQYMDAPDIEFVSTVVHAGFSNNVVPLSGELGASLLQKAAKTGRFYWQNSPPQGSGLTYGSPQEGELSWTILPDGRYKLTCHVQHPTPDKIILPMNPVHYVDPAHGTVGPVHTSLPPKTQERLLALPAMLSHEAHALCERLASLGESLAMPPLPVIEKKELKNISPTPCLRLYTKKLRRSPYYYYEPEAPTSVCVASLAFDYNGVRTPENQFEPIIIQVDGTCITEIIRSKRAEESAADALQDFGFIPLLASSVMYSVEEAKGYNDFVLGDHNTGSDTYAWIDFLLDMAPTLKAKGWKIEISPDFPINPHAVDQEIDFHFEDSSATDWFNLGVSTLTHDEKKINLLPLLATSIKQMNNDLLVDFLSGPDDSRYTIRMDDGKTYLSVELGRIRPILEFLRDLWHLGRLNLDKEGSVSLSQSDMLLLADTEAASESAQLRWFGDSKIKETIHKLKNFKEISPVEPPSDLQADLRPYQRDGLNWLGFLREYNFGGVLADDMGLGKTIQTLAWIGHEKQSGRLDRPCLVICPTSLVHNWAQEAEKFLPSLKVLPLQGKERKAHFGTLQDYDMVVTTYPLLTHDKEELLAQKYHAVILDEAQFIKNAKAHMTQIVHQLSARHRICLTGTPLENHLGELWSLFHFLQPGFLGDEKAFNSTFRRPIEKHNDADKQHLLQRRIRPFMLRRLKEDVANDLPPKTEIIRTVEMDKAQSDLYETIRLSMHDKVRQEIAKKGMARSHIVMLDALLKLRQVCCDPRLLKIESAKKTKAESAKLSLLMEMLPSLIEEGRKVLLFSQFTEMLGLIEEACKKADIPYVILTGQTEDRKTPINAFQNGDTPLFLISLKSGGTGLNLTAADTVIHYDPWWNPAVEKQATDRAHRIGQDKPVFVYKLLTAGTVEEKILDMQKRKQSLADALFDPDEKTKGKLTEDDISVLFEKI